MRVGAGNSIRWPFKAPSDCLIVLSAGMHAHVPVDLDTWRRGWYLKGTVGYILRAVRIYGYTS